MSRPFIFNDTRRKLHECEANYSCPNPKVPGSNLCHYHRAVADARAGDPEAIRVCRERYSLEFVEVAR